MSLDPVNALGLQLRRRVPTGEQLVEWLLDGDGLVPFADALLAYREVGEDGHEESPYGWPEIALAVHDLTRGMWSPGPDYLTGLYRQQGGTLAEPVIEDAA